MNSPVTSPSFAVVDAACRIKYISGGSSTSGELERIVASAGELQPDVEAFLRDYESSHSGAPVRTAYLDDERLLRVARLVGEDGTMFVLSVEEDPNRKNLSRAVRRHQLTRRETAVLTLILDGLQSSEIAQALTISENTVQGYFKRLLAKTGSRNRVSMIAKVLDWQPQTTTLAPAIRVAV
jgi:DNA-binding NarL/FixJ family response regulator